MENHTFLIKTRVTLYIKPNNLHRLQNERTLNTQFDWPTFSHQSLRDLVSLVRNSFIEKSCAKTIYLPVLIFKSHVIVAEVGLNPMQY